MHPLIEYHLGITRRHFFSRTATAMGSVALASLLNPEEATAASGLAAGNGPGYTPGQTGPLDFPPRVKRVIYLCQAGAPSQIDTFDFKPLLEKWDGQELPASVRRNQRLTGMTADQKELPVTKSFVPFKQHGASGQWISDLLPYHGKIADEIWIINSMYTEAINHDPAITFFQTGHQQPGRPSLGAWVSYGIGSESADLPAFVVLLDKNTDLRAQPLYARLWGSGFLPSNHQGIKLRSSGDPVLYLSDPTRASRNDKRDLLDRLSKLNSLRREQNGDPEIDTRMAAYEMAFRMQMSIPELTDISHEPQSTFDLYGPDALIPGTHAANCLLARKMAQRGVRFIQVYHRGWDHHSHLPIRHRLLAKEVDRGSAALVLDLKRHGLLDDTLIVWGGEFGRTVYKQGLNANYGRDHHPRCFSIWMAGGGIQGGMTYGKTDDWGYNIVDRESQGMHVHDLNATILYLLGIHHKRLTYKFQGRDYRLTDVHGRIVSDLFV